jgi:hypothetical protein
MGAVGHPKSPAGDTLLVLSPEHLNTLWRDGMTKQQLRDRIQEVTTRPLRDILQDSESGAGIPPGRFGADGPSESDLDQLVPKFRSTDNIHIVIAGGEAGKFSAVFAGWASGPIGSIPVSRKIEEV